MKICTVSVVELMLAPDGMFIMDADQRSYSEVGVKKVFLRWALIADKAHLCIAVF